MVQWTNTLEKHPSLLGYYYSYYFNDRDKIYYYKAIWWNGKNWVNWHKEPKYIETVEKFIEESRNDYYCPCVEWVNKMENDE